MSAVADKLREARALVERGWCQRYYSSSSGICALGAINKAITGLLTSAAHPQPVAVGAIETLKQAIRSGSIVAWNDAPERTQAEVLAAFDKAIELAEAQDA